MSLTLTVPDDIAQVVEETAQRSGIPPERLLLDTIRARFPTKSGVAEPETQQEYFERARAFLKMCQDNPIRPAVASDSGKDLREIRDERGDQL